MSQSLSPPLSRARDKAPEKRSRSTTEDILSSWLEIGRQLSGASDLAQGLDAVARRLRDQIGAETVALLLLDDRGHELRFQVALGFPDGVADHWRFGLGQGLVGTAAATGAPIRVDDVDLDERYLRACPSTRSELAVPLRVGDRVIGVLDLGSAEPAFFSAADERELSLLGDQLASAIETRRLYENVREQARVMSVLHQVSRELTSILDRGQVLERVAERLGELIPFDVFTVMLWNEQSRRLELRVTVRSDRLEGEPFRNLQLGEGICGSAAALRQPIRVPNVALDPRYVNCDSQQRVRSELAVPLVFEDRLIGVVDLESREYDTFRAHHEQILATLAPSLAIALVNAQTYEELAETQRRINEDLDTAREIQKQLLPTSTPWVPGVQIAAVCEPARYVGGDFYDFVRYGEGQHAIAVGDVAGKSTSAALYGALAVGMLRELATHRRPRPSEVLSEMNARLRQLGIPNRFLAMTFAVFEAGSGTLTVAASGLPYPFLIRGRTVRELEVRGIPLGLMPATYQEVAVRLHEGEALVFVTDGVAEAVNPEGLEFGNERLVGTLQRLAGGSSREIADGLLDAVRRFSGSAEPSDDRTVVVVKACGECF